MCIPPVKVSKGVHAFVSYFHSQAPRVNWVLDIGEALDTLGKVLQKYNFQNLDEIFPEENTTTEFMCRVSACACLPCFFFLQIGEGGSSA
jgi:hypothetical protein